MLNYHQRSITKMSLKISHKRLLKSPRRQWVNLRWESFPWGWVSAGSLGGAYCLSILAVANDQLLPVGHDWGRPVAAEGCWSRELAPDSVGIALRWMTWSQVAMTVHDGWINGAVYLDTASLKHQLHCQNDSLNYSFQNHTMIHYMIFSVELPMKF